MPGIKSNLLPISFSSFFLWHDPRFFRSLQSTRKWLSVPWDQCLSTGMILFPGVLWWFLKTFLAVYNHWGGWYWLLVCRGQRCCWTSCNAHDSFSRQKIFQPEISVVWGLRSPPLDHVVLDALKCGYDISPHVPFHIRDTCSLGSDAIRLSLNNRSLLPAPALHLGVGMVATVCAEPRFAVHPGYYPLHLVTRDSLDQKRNNTASLWTLTHSFMGVFCGPIMLSAVLSAGRQNQNALLHSWNLQSSQETWQNSGKHHEESPVRWYRVMAGKEKGTWEVLLGEGCWSEKHSLRGWHCGHGGSSHAEAEMEGRACAKDPRPGRAQLVGGTNMSIPQCAKGPWTYFRERERGGLPHAGVFKP